MTSQLPSFDQLEPRAVWQDFARMCRVPRPSKQEQRIIAALESLCRDRGFETQLDAVGNLIARVSASPGCEGAPTVILQGHVDMVCEKNADTEFDFDQDPIQTVVDRDAGDGGLIVRAQGTTLGADNGIGVCLALAAATQELRRPPLELLMTVDEEAGMTGAENLDGSLLKGKLLINLDTEADATLYVGCAGGCDSNISLRLETESHRKPVHRIVVEGLRGGHSGADIHQGRGCANRLLARVLDRVQGGVRIASLSGGSKRNAIAREALAWVAADPAELRQAAAAVEREGQVESKEPELRIGIEAEAETADRVCTDPSTQRCIRLMLGLPHGVIGMHPDIPELVETSNNLATVQSRLDGNLLEIEIGTLSRSSSDSRMEEALRQIEAVAALAGASTTRANAYPGWQPNMSSPLLALCRRVHERTFGHEPKAEAVHAGLECGLLGNRIAGLDMISLGPRIEGAHSPDERVWVESVQKSWEYLTAILDELATTIP